MSRLLKHKLLLVIAGLGVFMAVAVSFILTSQPAMAPMVTNTPEVTQKAPKVKHVSPAYDTVELQAIVDKHSAGKNFSVIVQSVASGEVLAASQADTTYFSASLYKLYYALLAVQDIDSGDLVLEDNFYKDYSTSECLDLMLRESHSPCGEEMLSRYDYTTATQRLRGHGMPHVDAAGFVVSASDMAVLLQLVYGNDSTLSTQAKQRIAFPMKTQIYDKGLRTGFAGQVIYDKVGFSSVDWHDVGVIEYGDEQIIVSVLTKNVGSTRIAALAKELNEYFLLAQ